MTTKQEIRAEISKLVDEYARLEFAETIFVAGESVIPPSGKLVGGSEMKHMVEAALDCWLTARFNSEFETRLKQFILWII